MTRAQETADQYDLLATHVELDSATVLEEGYRESKLSRPRVINLTAITHILTALFACPSRSLTNGSGIAERLQFK
jgi:hypothetical protein